MSAGDVLVLAEIQRDVLADVTLELLTAARGLAARPAGRSLALVLSPDGAGTAPSLARADRIVLLDDPQLAGYSPEPFLAALHEVVAAEEPRAVLIGGHVDRLGPGAAVGGPAGRTVGDRLQGGQADGDALASPHRSAAAKCWPRCRSRPRRRSSWCCRAVFARMARRERRSFSSGSRRAAGGRRGRIRRLGPARRPATWTSRSRTCSWRWARHPAEGQPGTCRGTGPGPGRHRMRVAAGGGPGVAARHAQVGKSGMTVKPKLYLALGISGAPEHQEGMKDAESDHRREHRPQGADFDVAHFGRGGRAGVVAAR